MPSNLAPGVGPGHSHFHQKEDMCPCGSDAPWEGETCEDCGRLRTEDGYVEQICACGHIYADHRRGGHKCTRPGCGCMVARMETA